MRKAKMIARITYVILAVIVLGLALSCGGGSKKTMGTLPSVSSSSGGSNASFDQVNRGACISEDDIYKLSPVLQELYNDPGWDGPLTSTTADTMPRETQSVDVDVVEKTMVTVGAVEQNAPEASVPMSTPVPPPPTLSIEGLAARHENAARVNRGLEPVMPVKSASYPYIPPDEPGYYTVPGEYDPNDWDGTGDPPWGSDGGDADILEDRIQRVDVFVEQGRSFVKLGLTTANQFNRGSAVASELSAVYQTYSVPIADWGEWSYPAEDTYDFVPEPAYFVADYIYDKLQMSTSVRRYSQMIDFAWYDILITPLDDVSIEYMSTSPPNETYARYQPYFYDAEKMPYGEAWMVGLTSSANEYIQGLIDLQASDNLPIATFPTFGVIHQRWTDDVWNMGVDPPWEGRLGWPLTDPFIDKGGRLLTGPMGHYYRYGQYFEKGFMWWLDYLDPMVPDEVFLYVYKKDSVLEEGGEFEQDPVAVRYGMGGPLGCKIFANPLIANLGDPIYFKAFPYGGPTDNVNGFADDWFLWNFRDGTVTPSSVQYPIHDYFVEAVYTARLMFTIDYDGDGNPDGTTEGYKVFADSPEIEIGHLGEPGLGTTLIVQDNTAPSGSDSLEHQQAFASDLDALGYGYDLATTGDITDVSDLEDYLLVIWCPPQSTNMYAFYEEQVDSGERSRILAYIQGGGNVILCTRCIWNNYGGVPQWQMMFGFQGDNGWFHWGGDGWVNLNPANVGSGPAGTIAQIRMPDAQNMATNFAFTWDYAMPGGAEVLGRYAGYTNRIPWTSRDNLPGASGGRASAYGYAWHKVTGSNPPAPGRAGALWNWLDFIDPMIEGGSPILPYEGPVDIADTFAWVYKEDGSVISGGDGDTPSDRAHVEVTAVSGPQKIWFECLARASEGIDLIYEWSFKPGDPFQIWTRYTNYAYYGAIDPDGPGPDAYGDPFPVNVRTFDSTAGSYGTAPPEARDSDSVLVEVAGELAVDIEDNGTVNNSPYDLNPDGSMTVTLDYIIEEGVPPYDSVWIDYDYDFVTFEPLVEVLPLPVQGTNTYDLDIPDVEAGYEYYVAIRVTDSDSANGDDTYAWLEPFKGDA